MIDQIIITGISGVLIIFIIMGFGMSIKIANKAKASNSWKNAIKETLGRSIFPWLSTLSFVLFVLMIITGITISIIFE